MTTITPEEWARLVEPTEWKVALQVITATFDDTRLWRMSDGATVFNVGIEDEKFLAEVDAHQATFGKGDVLRVKLRTEQTINSAGNLQTKHTITRVIERIPAPQLIMEAARER